MEIKQEIELVSTLKNAASNRSGVLLNAYISGSHLYGFESKDSDVDIRGCFALKPRAFFGLKKPIDIIELGLVENNDIVLFELKKMIGLAIKGNCNIIEEMNAPQFYKTADYLKLKELVNNAFGKKGLYNSYRGMATFNYKKFILGGKSSAKKYLYVFRGLMAGIYVLQTGLVKPNLGELNKYFKIPEVDALLRLKKCGIEKEPCTDLDTGILDVKIKELFDKLDEAYMKSKMPEEPTREEIDEIDSCMVSIREGLI